MGHPILEFLIAQSHRFQRDPYCPLCGNSLTFVDATFWIYEEDEARTIALPVCPACESETFTEKDSPISATALQDFGASGWKLAYLAALFETDKSKINSLIAAAEMAVALRARELLGAEGDHSRERAALDTALINLHSLRDVTGANDSSTGGSTTRGSMARRIVAANDLIA